MTPIFYIKDGCLSFGDNAILSNLELYISQSDRICLVGKNGSGKSTLMKIIYGDYDLDSGELFCMPTTNIGYLRQDFKNISDISIYDFVLQDFKEPEHNKYQADIIFKQLDINGDKLLKECSGGQARRAFLAKSLIDKPDILLLDEPTNHLDISAIEWLEDYIKNYSGAVICISHDRTFQENVTNKVWWIDRGILRKSDKGFKHYDQWREEIIEQEEAALRKMNRKLDAEQSWLHGGVTARRKRNQQRLAGLYRLREKIKDHENHLSNAKANLEIKLLEEEKKSKFIIEANNISFSFYGKTLFKDFSFKVKKGEKIGVIGPNGCGKSTLVKLLIKEIDPSLGKVKHAANLDITYFDQHRTELNQDHTIKQTFCESGGDQILIGDKFVHVVSYLKKFMFDPKIINDKVSTLSGGQSSRLLLAKSLINPGNFLILDEPTNDLDMDSLEMLLEILADYKGTLIIISHDRDFLERLVTRTLVFSDDKIIDLYGGYNDYQKFYKKTNTQLENKKKTKPINNIANKDNKKLSYKYARLLEILPVEIEDLEKKITLIEQKLSENNLYNSNQAEFQKLTNLLTDSKSELEEKINQWIEIDSMNNA